MSATTVEVIRQHLIDPEICIRCNTCEETCPVDAVTHDARNYVVDVGKCNGLQRVHFALPHRRHRQLAAGREEATPTRWTSSSRGTACRRSARSTPTRKRELPTDVARITALATAGQGGTAAPPWSAAHPYVNLYTIEKPAIATVTGNFRLTGDGASSDIRHIVLDFGGTAFPVLEGQTIGIVPPGHDAIGQAAPRAPLLGREPARGRAAAVQQSRADGEARHRGSRRQARARASPRTTCAISRKATQVNVVGPYGTTLPDAQPSGIEPADGLHGHGVGADAGDDRAQAAPHRAARKAAS